MIDSARIALCSVIIGAAAASAAPPGPESPSSAPDPAAWPRARLVALLRDLADEVYDRFVVTDPDRRVYGMAYEFVRDGKHIQAFGLDSMHDGAWFTSALVTAHRIDPEGGYLERALRYQVPFYVNVLTNSDRLFPRMVPREGQEEFEKPITGWAPRGWDDGPGIDLPTGKPFSSGIISHENGTVVERDAAGNFLHSYFTSSHHLLQDLADSLMNVWLTTRDPSVARAIRLIHEGRVKHGRRIPVVQKAAGLTNALPDLCRRARPPQFAAARAFRPLWQAIVEGAAARTGHYNDGLAWQYREECARAALAGAPIAPGFTANAVGRVYSHVLVTEAFFTPEKYRPGYTLTGLTTFKKGTGRLTRHYAGKGMMRARGMQQAWIAAALIPSFRADPGAWNDGMRKLAADRTAATLTRGVAALGVRFHTDPDKVAARLDRFVLGTIDYWAGVRKKRGYLPRGYFPDGRNATWVRTAELGAYAHLMKAIAFRIMAIDGVTERELIRTQAPEKPIPFTPLPDSVLKIQGLK